VAELMIVFVLLLIVIAAIVVLVAGNKRRQREAFESTAAADPLHPVLEAVLHTGPEQHWTTRRAAHGAVRGASDDILGLLAQHGEAPLLITHSTDVAFPGLLVITQGRTLLYARGSRTEVPHVRASTSIRASGPADPRPFVEVSFGGTVIRVAASSVTEAQLICATIDVWADSPDVEPDARVVVTRREVRIDDAFYADTLRRAGHPATPYNMRSIHERFGMQLHGRAVKYLEGRFGSAATERFTAVAGRPTHDRDLPQWPTRVMREWIAFDDDIAPVAAHFPLWTRAVLLDTARTGGYLAPTGRPLSMWRSEWYDDDGRGARKALTS
jgi:hypothetical protein